VSGKVSGSFILKISPSMPHRLNLQSKNPKALDPNFRIWGFKILALTDQLMWHGGGDMTCRGLNPKL
jgi:hypothetical protein